MAGSRDFITRNCFEIPLFFPLNCFYIFSFVATLLLTKPSTTETPTHLPLQSFSFFENLQQTKPTKIKWYKNQSQFHFGMFFFFSSSSLLLGFCYDVSISHLIHCFVLLFLIRFAVGSAGSLSPKSTAIVENIFRSIVRPRYIC